MIGCALTEPANIRFLAHSLLLLNGFFLKVERQLSHLLEDVAEAILHLDDVVAAIALVEVLVLPVEQEQDAAKAVDRVHEVRNVRIDDIRRVEDLDESADRGLVEDVALTLFRPPFRRPFATGRR